MPQIKWVPLAFLVSAGLSFAQPPTSPATPPKSPIPNEIKLIGEDVSVIEETTLLPFAGYGADKETPGITATQIGDSQVKYYSAATGETIRDAYEEAVTSMRCYGFTLAPGEKLQVELKVKSASKMVMRFVPRPVADTMTSQVRRANLPPRPIRSSRIEIRNITEKPYQVNLALSGLPNYPYKLEIQRKKD